MPRRKPSGIPFLVKFVDVAVLAALSRPPIYGEDGREDHILETI